MRLNRHRDTHAVVTLRVLLPTLALTLLVTSCNPDGLSGKVVLSGSSTLAPLASQTVEKWKKIHPRVETRVEAIGSDAGLDRLIRFDDADLALVSRPLSDQDRAAGAAAGKTLVALPLAWDAVVLVVPRSNTWAKSLSNDQVVRAFTDATVWSDLDPSWPSQPLHRFVLGPRSGTTDIFATVLLGGAKEKLFASPSVQSSEDDRILARGVAQVEGSVGFLGWTTVREADLPLRVVALGGVEPSAATIRDGTYGLPRQLWVVGDRSTWKNRPEVVSLVKYFYDHYAEITAGTPLVPLSDDERRAAETTLKKTL